MFAVTYSPSHFAQILLIKLSCRLKLPFNIPFLPILLQKCWGRSYGKWLQLPQLCPSTIIIFQLSPVLQVSASHVWLCVLQPDHFCLNVRQSFLNFFFTFSSVPARDVLKDIEKLIPSFRGVKFSGSDLMDFGQCVSYSQPHWSLLYGVDEVSSLYSCSYREMLWLHCGALNRLFVILSVANACSSGFGSPRSSWQVSAGNLAVFNALSTFTHLCFLCVNHKSFLYPQHIQLHRMSCQQAHFRI